MDKAETITREEAEKSCGEIVQNIREAIVDKIQALHILMQGASKPKEFEVCCEMAGDYLTVIIQNANDILDDIKNGRFLPRQEGVKS